jgi:hypothetical protein
MPLPLHCQTCPSVPSGFINSTDTCCCGSSRSMLASLSMIAIPISDCVRAVEPVSRHTSPERRFHRASSCLPRPAKLELSLRYRKHRTSEFLIDNFERLRHEGVHPACPEIARREPSRRVELYSLPLSTISNFGLRCSRFSNRHTPRLEWPVSYRKQRAANFLIATFGDISLPRSSDNLPLGVRRPCV